MWPRIPRKFLVLWLLAVLAALFMGGSAVLWAERPIPKPQGLVNDFAGVLEAPYKGKIRAVVRELFQKTKVPVVVVTMPDIGGAEYNDYANRLYETWGIGRKGEDKGVLIFITLKERKMRIETGYGVEGILPDGLVGEIRDRYMLPYLKQDRFGEGVLNGVLAVAQVIAKDAGVTLSGAVPPKASKASPRKRSRGSLLPILGIILFLMVFSGRRRGAWIFFLPWILGGGMSGRGGGSSGGFGGFSGGFGGFGGGMSGGGGAGGSF